MRGIALSLLCLLPTAAMALLAPAQMTGMYQRQRGCRGKPPTDAGAS